MKCVLRAWGQFKRGSEVVALVEMCCEGMGAVEKGVRSGWHWVKCVFTAWGQLKRGFQVVPVGEMCFEGMGAGQKGVRGGGSG